MQKRSRLLFCLPFTLFALCVWPGQQAEAQGVKNAASHFKRAFTTTKLTPPKVERILKERVSRTRKQLPPIPKKQLGYWPVEKLPIVRFSKWETRRPLSSPYENIPFWDQLSSEAKRNYFIAANNRALKTFLKRRSRVFNNTKRMAPILWKNRVKTGDQPLETADLTKIMLERIPKNTDYLLLGERHEFPAMHTVMARFLRQVRAQNPDRKIFLLTEFLPSGGIKPLLLQTMKEADPSYAHVLDTAQKMGMLVRGLEPRFVCFSDTKVEVAHEAFALEEGTNVVPAAATAEGMRLRNRQWIANIQNLRKHNPDALFIIWAGTEHVNYLVPFSIGSQLPADKTFLITFFYQKSNDPKIHDLLDFVGQAKYPFFAQRLLTWDNPALRRAAGFDMRIVLNQNDFPKGRVGKFLKALYQPLD